MIKIIKGVYGFRKGSSVIPKTKNDEPFPLNPEDEQRLVDIGVAEYVKEEKADSSPNDNNGNDDTTGEKEKLVARFKELGGKGPATTWKLETLKSKIEELENKKQTSDTDADADAYSDTDNDNDEIEGEIESDDAAPDLSGENGVA